MSLLPARPPLEQSNILVTGASSGIGWELARQLTPFARNLVLVARRAERLQQLQALISNINPHTKVWVKACDLRDQAAVKKLLEELQTEVGTIDVLVNNAGQGDFSLLEKTSWEKTQSLIDLNVVALTSLTYHLLPAMVSQGRGGILNVSSGLGFVAMPGLSAYTGTKHFVTGFSEALRAELNGTGVIVTQVCPGPVDTEFEGSRGRVPMPKGVVISAEQCAAEAIEGFRQGRAIVFPGRIMKVVMKVAQFVPPSMLRAVFSQVGTLVRRRNERVLPTKR